MFRNILLFVISLIVVVALIGCTTAPSSGTSPTSGGAPAAAATNAPARGAGTPLAVPPQPTSPAVSTRAVTPFVSPTFVLIVQGPTSTSTPRPTAAPPTATPGGAATSTPTAAPTATRAPATATSAAAPAVKPGGRAEFKGDFTTPLVTAELIDEVAEKLKTFSGIIAVSGNENAVTIAYDPGLITPEKIREALTGMGHGVK